MTSRVSLERLAGVALDVRVIVGRASVKIEDVLRYAPGTIVALDTAQDDPVSLFINGIRVAEGDLVLTDDDMLGLEIVRVVGANAEEPEA